MRRGTTPTLTMHVDDDLTGCEVHVTLAQKGKQIHKRESDLDIQVSGGATTVKLRLTQAETLSLSSERGSCVEVQMRYKRGEDAYSTQIGSVPVERILQEGAI